MMGKVLNADKNFKVHNKLNSNMVKVSSSKSILSYQNGSALNSENCGCTTEERMPENSSADDSTIPSEDPLVEDQNLKSECLDLLRKKLISDLSLTVFSCDLENKLSKMEPIQISVERQSVIQKLVVQISQLSDPEKLLLYLKLPSTTRSPFDPLRQPLNPLGNRQEIQQTIVWIKTHLEEDSEISIPKQDVYDQYIKYCENVSMKPLSTADFGKVMKQVYPGVRPRRLGTRGNSRYCYSGMRNTCKLPTPILPRSSMENTIPNGCGKGVPSLIPAEAGKVKKLDKAKRKMSLDARNEKCGASKKLPSPEKISMLPTNALKRLKPQKDLNSTKDEETEENADLKIATSNDLDLRNVEFGDGSENAISAFNIQCELRNSFEDYLKESDNEDKNEGGHVEEERTKGNELRRSREIDLAFQKDQNVKISDDFECKNNKSGFRSRSRSSTEAESETATNISLPPSTNGDQTTKSVLLSKKINGLENKCSTMLEKLKGSRTKGKRSSGSFVKHTSKAFKKSSYVPIQPKPAAEMKKVNIRFESSNTVASIDKKNEAEGMTLCDESDSQEPEEEIARYFKHLDEGEIVSANGLVDRAVNNDSNSVQINGISQIMAPNQIPYEINGEKVINQQILRSQSCFEDNGGRDFDLKKKQDSGYLPRSQSSVELLGTRDRNLTEMIKSKSDSDADVDDKKNKISHLRILLEKSVTSSTTHAYSHYLTAGTGGVSGAQNSLNKPFGQIIPIESNLILTNVKSPDRNFLKLNGSKVVATITPITPQSPNTRAKYFNFTPISSGPSSPLKTSSANFLMSPRDTSVPRSRQNAYNDHFLSPTKRKAVLSSENFFDFNKSLTERSRIKKSPTLVQGFRPRSNSSTNFYRSSSFKFDDANQIALKNQIQTLAQNGTPLNSSSFSLQEAIEGNNILPTRSVLEDIQQYPKASSKVMTENQGAIIRSRSVPLNRMISESSWVSAQASPIYSTGYFSSENNSQEAKFSNMAPSSEDPLDKRIPTANIADFVNNTSGISALDEEIFTGNSSLVTLNDQYFSGSFQRSSDETFSEDSTFSNKLNLDSNGTFDSALGSDADNALTENIKSYLQHFDSLDNKGLVEGSGGGPEVENEGKLFKSALYEEGNDNLKDPVITSFKPVLMNEMTDSPESPVLNFFSGKINEDSQQLIEFFDFED